MFDTETGVSTLVLKEIPYKTNHLRLQYNTSNVQLQREKKYDMMAHKR